MELIKKCDPIILDIETAGLNSQEDFISCVGVMTGTGIHQFSTYSIMEEKQTIEAFLNFAESFPLDYSLVTYNGKSFDIPYILTRCEMYGFALPPCIHKDHIDMMPFVHETNGRRMSMGLACRKYCDLYVPKCVDSLFMARAYKMNRVTPLIHSQMLQHNAIDLTATFQLYNQLLTYPDFRSYLNKKEEDDKHEDTENM